MARRDRRWWLAFVGLAVAGAVGVTLSSGVTATDRPSAVRAAGDAVAVQRDDGRTWQVVPFHPGTEAEVSFVLAQRGPLPVRFDAISDSRARAPVDCGWNPERAVVTDAEQAAGVRPGSPVTDGVRLDRGERVTVAVSGTFIGEPGCLLEGRAVSRPTFLVDVRVAGLPRRQRVRPSEVLAWSTDPDAIAERWTRMPVAPRVGTVP